MFTKLFIAACYLFYILAPNGKQLEKAAEFVKKEAPKYADDVVRAVSKNSGFLESIPSWLWWVFGIRVVIVVIIAMINDDE